MGRLSGSSLNWTVAVRHCVVMFLNQMKNRRRRIAVNEIYICDNIVLIICCVC